MGAEPWQYFVAYQPNLQGALENLRQQEFRAGRFRGSELKPATIEEAFENMDADGTASILDIERVAEEPEGRQILLGELLLLFLVGRDALEPRRAERPVRPRHADAVAVAEPAVRRAAARLVHRQPRLHGGA